MKKVICAVAAFAMVAGLATVASAEVKLSGDARARWIYSDNGIDGMDDDKLDSRIRVVMSATTEGGAYAKMRLRFLDGKWGQGNESPYGAQMKGDYNVWSDYAFLGFKAGKFDVAAGKMPIGFSTWFLDDERADRFRVKYTDGGLLVAATYDKKRETGAADDDKQVYGVTYKQKFSDDITASFRGVYVDDQAPADRSGVKASANVKMNFAGNNIFIEQSYKENGVQSYSARGQEALTAGDVAAFANTLAEYALGRDTQDQWGGYAEWNATYGTITPVVRLGYTSESFTADETFGWLMIGGDEPISQITRVGQGGDTIFFAASSKFQTAEDLSFQANFVYMDIDSETFALADGRKWHTSLHGDNPIELSGSMAYDINKNTTISVKGGWLLSDSDYANVDDAFAAYAKMAIRF